MIKNSIIIAVCLVLMALTYAWWEAYKPAKDLFFITTFEECERAGYLVMESFPRQCVAPDGRVFVSREEPTQYAP